MPIAASDVAIAGRSLKRIASISSGTITIPPPTPNRALKKPATTPMRARPRQRAYPKTVALPPLLAELARAPGEAALLLDVDGVLAPIVPRPEDARVPDETRAELAPARGALRARRLRDRQTERRREDDRRASTASRSSASTASSSRPRRAVGRTAARTSPTGRSGPPSASA